MRIKQLGMLAVSSLMLATGTVLAESEVFEGSDWSGWTDDFYLVGGVGYGRVDHAAFDQDKKPLLGGALGPNLGSQLGGTLTSFADSTKPSGNIGWRAGAGTWFTKHFGLELNYYGIANMNDGYSDADSVVIIKVPEPIRIPPGKYTLGFDNDLEVTEMYSFDLTGTTRFFFTENLWGFGRLGVGYSHIERSVTSETNSQFRPIQEGPGRSRNGPTLDIYNENSGEVGLAAAIGLQWDVHEVFGIRLEGNTIQTTDNDADMYMASANLVLNIGELLEEF